MKKSILIAIVISSFAVLGAKADDVKALYEQQCQKCHGADGKGDTKMGKKLGAKDYTDPKVQEEMKDEKAFKSIKEGLIKDDKTLMKPVEGISDDQIKALIVYMRSFKKS